MFVIFIDIYILNHDGNLLDASAMASLVALINTKVFNYEVEDGEVNIKSGYTQLPLLNYPLAFSLAKIGDKLIMDPSFEEEQIMDARLTISLDKDGNICAVQKSGFDYFTQNLISAALKLAQEKDGDLRKIVVGD